MVSGPFVDMTLCEKEKIHIPGSIQPFAYMLVVNADGELLAYSDNCVALFDKVDLTIVKSIKHLFNSATITKISNEISKSPAQRKYFELEISKKQYSLMIINSSPDNYLCVLESTDSKISASKLQKFLKSLHDSQMSEIDFDGFVEGFRGILGMDRVMVYKFYKDYHGEVIAESKSENLTSYLNRHFPAHDIPAQARELYKSQKIRLIRDNADKQVGFKLNQADLIIDMTETDVRSVSPVHIRYMQNMGTRSSFSISIVVDDKLWGLISCHASQPTYFSYSNRLALSIIGDILADKIDLYNSTRQVKYLNSAKAEIDACVVKNSANSFKLLQLDVNNSFLKLIDADAVVILGAGKINSSDSNLNAQTVLHLLNNIVFDAFGLYCSEDISAEKLDVEFKQNYNGVLAIRLGENSDNYILWLRKPIKQQTQWAGNPHAALKVDKNNPMRLMPRASFDLWLEETEDKAKAWDDSEIEYAKHLVVLINDRLAK